MQEHPNRISHQGNIKNDTLSSNEVIAIDLTQDVIKPISKKKAKQEKTSKRSVSKKRHDTNEKNSKKRPPGFSQTLGQQQLFGLKN